MNEDSSETERRESGYSKDFDYWNEVKKRLDASGRLRSVRPGEVYWVSVGVNVGSEIDGKGAELVRPVLVLKKDSRRTFAGLPFTTSPHDGQPGYVKIMFDKKIDYVALNQYKTFAMQRIINPAGKISTELMEHIKECLREYLEL